jgi:predicted GTPase
MNMFLSHRHHLEHAFHSDSETAMLEADVIGVVHDVSNTWTRDRLDPKVLRLLYLYPRKHSFLILNKVCLYHVDLCVLYNLNVASATVVMWHQMRD